MASPRVDLRLHTSPFFPVRLARRVVAMMAAMGLCTASLVAAQTAIPVMAVSFDIVPAAAGAGVARQISVSLPWPSGCLPSGATVVGNDLARKRTLTLRLDGNLRDIQRCGDMIVNYRATARITPNAEGDMRVLVVTNDGVYLGETTIHTRAAGSDRSQVDLTGMWYDPATFGSGLTFVHGFTRDDVVFGTWYVYDAQGVARWYTIQSVQWKAGGLEAEGLIYETSANSGACVPPMGCPVMFATVTSLARARIVVQGSNSAQIQALTPGGTVLFASTISRSIF